MKEKIEITLAKGIDDHKMMEEEKCEYCKEDMKGKPISNKYAIETIVDDKFLYNYCECGLHTVVEINYCPMCGERIKNNENND